MTRELHTRSAEPRIAARAVAARAAPVALADRVLALQRCAGNRVVGQVLARAPGGAKVKPGPKVKPPAKPEDELASAPLVMDFPGVGRVALKTYGFGGLRVSRRHY